MEIKICKWCSSIITARPGQTKRDVRVKKFCDQRCSALYNNRNGFSVKRKREGKCLSCGTVIYSHLKYCNRDCRNKATMKFSDRTKIEVRRTAICWHARCVLERSKTEKSCRVCGYSFVVQVCHVKAVKDFRDEEILSVINDVSNLVYLCPNHHIEFDRGLLKFGSG